MLTFNLIKLLKRQFLSLCLLVIQFYAPFVSAQYNCQNLFIGIETKEPFGAIRSDFIHNDKYSKELPYPFTIKNQGCMGTCSIHTWISVLEQNYFARTQKKLKLSIHFLTALLWYSKAIFTLENIDNSTSITHGGTIDGSHMNIFKLGVIPKNEWKSSKVFMQNSTPKIMNITLRNIIAHNKIERNSEPDELKKIQIMEKGKAEINKVFNDTIGEFPQNFSLDGVEYTPQKFLKSFFPNMEDPMILIKTLSDPEGNTILRTENKHVPILVYETNINNIENIARQLIDQGLSFYLGFDNFKEYIDSKTGIMSISAFIDSKSDYWLPLPRWEREQYGIKVKNHAVHVIGYDLNEETGIIDKWKIVNSYGPKSGDHGFYHMYRDFFLAFVNKIGFINDSRIQLPEVKNKP